MNRMIRVSVLTALLALGGSPMAAQATQTYRVQAPATQTYRVRAPATQTYHFDTTDLASHFRLVLELLTVM